MRRIRSGGGLESYWLIEYRVVRAGSLVDHCRVHVGLERGSNLPQSLRGTVEFRFAEISAAYHCLDAAGGIVDCYQCSLRAGILLQFYARRAVRV